MDVGNINYQETWGLRDVEPATNVEGVTGYHVKNTKILGKAGLVDRELFENTQRRKIGYLRHILLILQGKIWEGKRGESGRKSFWQRNIRQWTGIRPLQTAAIDKMIEWEKASPWHYKNKKYYDTELNRISPYLCSVCCDIIKLQYQIVRKWAQIWLWLTFIGIFAINIKLFQLRGTYILSSKF